MGHGILRIHFGVRQSTLIRAAFVHYRIQGKRRLNHHFGSMGCKCIFALIATSAHSQYSYVPGDQAGLITLYGGPAGFVKRLDYLHDTNITYIGNEVHPNLSVF